MCIASVSKCERGRVRGRCGREHERKRERERVNQQHAAHVTQQRRA